MTIARAIRQEGLGDELRAFAQPHVLNPAVIAWLKAHPKLAGLVSYFPPTIRDVRRDFGCPAKKGGTRPRGPKFYEVSSVKRGPKYWQEKAAES